MLSSTKMSSDSRDSVSYVQYMQFQTDTPCPFLDEIRRPAGLARLTRNPQFSSQLLLYERWVPNLIFVEYNTWRDMRKRWLGIRYGLGSLKQLPFSSRRETFAVMVQRSKGRTRV